ncbi:MAG: non-lysosomal glucosylceramidase [Oscillospiraceae bacterium]|nr:non-lysosomal glucosylceramidase [Oscillospiraceae bacterium]
MKRNYNGVYERENTAYINFPLGGIGSGNYCISGTGMPGGFSLRNSPNIFFNPNIFAAISVKSNEPNKNNTARILEGQIPKHEIFKPGPGFGGSGNGLSGKNYGLPRFLSNGFISRFPFAEIKLSDPDILPGVSIRAWSPFIPSDSYNSSLPCATLEYNFDNNTGGTIEGVYYFCSLNFMKINDNGSYVKKQKDGFILGQKAVEADNKPWQKGEFYIFTDEENAHINPKLFRGGWWDTLTMLWNNISDGVYENSPDSDSDSDCEIENSPGGYIAIPFKLKSGESKTIKINTCWYVGESDLNCGPGFHDRDGGDCETKTTHKPWYSGQFADIFEIGEYYRNNFDTLKTETEKFSECFYDSTLPGEILEAVSANLSILKSPTVLRQTDGRLWCWEGCSDEWGSCHGSCTHVWNYAQAFPHLFPDLERTLRETEFFVSQAQNGHQNFRTPLPIREPDHNYHAASDGQLGGIMKVFREWKISGDDKWLKNIWGKVKDSLDYCIESWDKKREGVLREPHHNTYDIEFWGADGMCSSFYLGALKAAYIISDYLGEKDNYVKYNGLYKSGREYLENKLFNGEFFIQETEWLTLEAKLNLENETPESRELCEAEGPKYQYGKGCISDGVLGAWLAEVCGVGEILDPEKIKSHLLSVYKYNLKRDLSRHANPQRPGYALGKEGGLLLCGWPNGEKPSLPFVYSDEVWTGIEYQAAGHLIMHGCLDEGLDIVRTCRDRYDGTVRNPYDEYECGHFYARALASYGLLQAVTGAVYDSTAKTLEINPVIKGDFKSFISTDAGYGNIGVKDGEPFVNIIKGRIDINIIKYNNTNMQTK